jgi:methionyl-tRNA formyltransferase
MERLAEIGAESLSETLSHLDEITPKAQDHQQATFAPILKKEDGLIDWATDAAAIERRIRGLQPWPTAYTNFNARGLTIWRGKAVLATDFEAEPGTLIVARGEDLIVQCGEHTALRLLEVQPEARKRLAVRDFINGMHVKVGDRFGKA